MRAMKRSYSEGSAGPPDPNRVAGLVPEAVYQIKHCGQYHTQENASGQGKIKRPILAAIIDVSRQAPERQVGSAKPHEQ
jgi:hypothetical protein